DTKKGAGIRGPGVGPVGAVCAGHARRAPPGGTVVATSDQSRGARRSPPFRHTPTGDRVMRVAAIVGVLLIVFGIVALSVGTVTFFPTERVVDAGPFKIDVHKPHTIVFHPAVGAVALIGGIVLLLAGRRSGA